MDYATLAVYNLSIQYPHAIKAINFGIGSVEEGKGLILSPDKFEQVFKAIKNGRITVKVSNDLPEEAGAHYDEEEDILYVRTPDPSNNIYDRSLVLHELCHAVMDMLKYTGTTIGDAETAAYIAQAVFIRKAYPNFSLDQYNDLIRAAEKIATVCNLLNSPEKPTLLNGTQIHALKHLIEIHPLYKKYVNDRLLANGLKGPS
jgi:hypothetical protein